MSSIIFGPFRSTFRYLQRQSHENPTIVASIAVGCLGPILVFTVPPIRRRFGWKPAERIPTTYPLPQRAREEVTGYDDEE